MEGVSVRCTCGKGTSTDSTGNFKLQIELKDSIWFSYFGKNTQKYPVDTITNPGDFEIALHIDVPWLPEVKVRGKNYNLDSIENRKEYSNIFNYRKPGLRLSESAPSTYVPGSLTAGFDLDELITMFRFKKNREMLSVQQRLLQEEQDKYVNHRFNKRFIQELTNLKSPQLDTFILYFKPSYELLLNFNDLELGFYIQQSFKQFLIMKQPVKITGE